MDYFNKPVLIDEIPVNIVIKCGIVNYPMHAKDGYDLFKKIGRILGINR